MMDRNKKRRRDHDKMLKIQAIPMEIWPWIDFVEQSLLFDKVVFGTV